MIIQIEYIVLYHYYLPWIHKWKEENMVLSSLLGKAGRLWLFDFEYLFNAMDCAKYEWLPFRKTVFVRKLFLFFVCWVKRENLLIV